MKAMVSKQNVSKYMQLEGWSLRVPGNF